MEEELKTTTWSDGSEDELVRELVRELLDDVSPFLVAPQEMMIMSEYNSSPSNDSSTNHLVSVACSGPTMVHNIDNALSATNCKHHLHQDISQTRISILEKGWSKVENKYTLKIKSCGSGMADDGYKWRKYGQKSIKNSPFPRSYYRCTNPGCSAKKQVERSMDDDDTDTLIITYEGLHLHYAYPYFLLSQPQHVDPPSKKLKSTISKAEAQAHEALPPTEENKGARTNSSSAGPFVMECMQEWSQEEGKGPQGLLEDMVPLMIRNPTNNHHFSSNSSSSSSSSSYPSPPTSPSSLSWSPNYSSSYFNIGL